jgi:hypothetical protein
LTCPDCGLEYRPRDSLKHLCPGCLYRGLAGESAPDLAEELRTHAARPGRFRPPKTSELQPHFPHLEIIELLGQGGMSAVYKARQKSIDRVVALKILPLEVAEAGGGVERFARETRTLARLSHPNIVTLYDAGQAGPWCYCIMEFISGPNLRQLLGDSRLSPADVLRIVPDICDGLQFAHDQGVVHRDMKPENVLIDEHGRAKIADFGLARVLPSSVVSGSLTATHQVVGTPRYIAPEQMDRPREVDPRADLYSLGVMLYEMLTGEIPAGHFQPPSRKSDSDARLDEVVLRALAREPARRYQNARALRNHLLSLPAHQSAVARVEPGWTWGRPAELFYSTVSLATVVGGVLAAGIGARENLMNAWRAFTRDDALAEYQNAAMFGLLGAFLFAISVLFARINVASARTWRDLSLAQTLSTPSLCAGYLLAGSVLLFLPGALIMGIGGVPLISPVDDWNLFGQWFGEAERSQILTRYWLTTTAAAMLVSAVWALALAAVAQRWPVVRVLFHPAGESASRTIAIGLLVLACAVFLPAGCAFLITARFVG